MNEYEDKNEFKMLMSVGKVKKKKERKKMTGKLRVKSDL